MTTSLNPNPVLGALATPSSPNASFLCLLISFMGNKKSKPQGKEVTPPPVQTEASSSSTPTPTPQNKRPSLNTKLAEATRYTTADVRSLHTEFKSIAARTIPANRITREQFRDILSDHRVSWRSDTFCARLFDYFDKREDGSINFGEFVRGLALASSGDPRDKLKLSFDVFDVEGTGTIARWEMRQVLEGIFVTAEHFQYEEADGSSQQQAEESRQEVETSLQKEHRQQQRATQIETFVNTIFTSYDKDQTGQLSFMEYMQAAMKYPNLTSFMKNAASIFEHSSKTEGEAKKNTPTADLCTAAPQSFYSCVRPHHNDHHVNISKNEILTLKTTFDRLSRESTESPNEIEKQQFKDVLDEFNIEWKNDDYLNRLFDVVDTHGSNTINYQECLIGLSMLLDGSPHERLSLSFELFDVNGSGTISKSEMTTVLRALGKENTVEQDITSFVEQIFQQADKNQSGSLTLREFVNAALKFNDLLVKVGKN